MGILNKFVQVGRLVCITKGEHTNKVAVITDIINFNRVVIDGPTTGVPKQVITLRRLKLTDEVVQIKRGASTCELIGGLSANDVVAKWRSSKWGKKVAQRKTIKSLNDFQRHQVLEARKAVRIAMAAN